MSPQVCLSPGATSGNGELLLLLGGSERPSSKDGTVQAELVKFTAEGEEILRKPLPTQKDEMNITSHEIHIIL